MVIFQGADHSEQILLRAGSEQSPHRPWGLGPGKDLVLLGMAGGWSTRLMARPPGGTPMPWMQDLESGRPAWGTPTSLPCSCTILEKLLHFLGFQFPL